MTSEKKDGDVVLSSLEETSGLFRMSVQNQFDTRNIVLTEKGMLDQQISLSKARRTELSFARSSYDDVCAFFQEASKDYDSDLVNPYWAFTHEILKFILMKFITEHFHDARTIRMFDAGAGTGNWSRFVLNLGIGMRGIMFDMNANMLKMLRIVSVEKGYDPGDFTLVAFGGNGPVHAAELADDLGIKEVLVPPAPGEIEQTIALVALDLQHVLESVGRDERRSRAASFQ